MAAGIPRRKLVIVGDGACGKTSLLIAFKQGTFNDEYIPTVFENSVADIDIDGRWIELALWDTAGQEDYDRLRPLCYPDTHIVLLCFSIDNIDSFENIEEKWVPEITHYTSGTPVLLVGCKSDLRIEGSTSTAQIAVSPKQGEALARKISAIAYIECSARSGSNVASVFQIAGRAAIGPRTIVSRPSCRLF